jgi:hypothetical protein
MFLGSDHLVLTSFLIVTEEGVGLVLMLENERHVILSGKALAKVGHGTLNRSLVQSSDLSEASVEISTHAGVDVVIGDPTSSEHNLAVGVLESRESTDSHVNMRGSGMLL